VTVDLAWAVAAGLAIGALCGAGVVRLVLYLRRASREAAGLEEFIALGLIALSYGLALLAGAYGFLAVFAAGLSMRRVERQHSEGADRADETPARMAREVLGFNEQLERLGEFAIVVVVGALLADIRTAWPGVVVALLLFVAIRPAATLLTLVRSPLTPPQRAVIAWFGVRGVGSIYYLSYAIAHGLPGGEARALADITLVVVAGSIVLHGVSVTPLMERYTSLTRRRRTRRPSL
jgi:NhaP-type Na+/H+ or K+/H+ antiporter